MAAKRQRKTVCAYVSLFTDASVSPRIEHDLCIRLDFFSERYDQYGRKKKSAQEVRGCPSEGG